MADQGQNQVLFPLKKAFPGCEKRIETLYRQDPVFRQITLEYHECICRREMDETAGREAHDIYADTIRELIEELREYLVMDPFSGKGYD